MALPSFSRIIKSGMSSAWGKISNQIKKNFTARSLARISGEPTTTDMESAISSPATETTCTRSLISTAQMRTQERSCASLPLVAPQVKSHGSMSARRNTTSLAGTTQFNGRYPNTETNPAPQNHLLVWKAGGVPQRSVAEAGGRLMYEVGLYKGEWYWLHNWHGIHQERVTSEEAAKAAAQADFASRQSPQNPPLPAPYYLRVKISCALDRFGFEDSTPEQVENFLSALSYYGLQVFHCPLPAIRSAIEDSQSKNTKAAFQRGFESGVRNAAEGTVIRLRSALENCVSIMKMCSRPGSENELTLAYLTDGIKAAEIALANPVNWNPSLQNQTDGGAQK